MDYIATMMSCINLTEYHGFHLHMADAAAAWKCFATLHVRGGMAFRQCHAAHLPKSMWAAWITLPL
jgi:hypothetical protein